jgi:hypothetical protein
MIDRVLLVVFYGTSTLTAYVLIMLAIDGGEPGWVGVGSGALLGLFIADVVVRVQMRRFSRSHPGFTAAVARLSEMAREDEDEFNRAVAEIVAEDADD